MMHQSGAVMPSRGDGLNWLKCTQCGREWAEKDSGAFAKGSRTCAGSSGLLRRRAANVWDGLPADYKHQDHTGKLIDAEEIE